MPTKKDLQSYVLQQQVAFAEAVTAGDFDSLYDLNQNISDGLSALYDYDDDEGGFSYE